MKKLVFALLVFQLFSCSTDNLKKNSLTFGGNENWHLDSTDIILETTDSLAEVFNSRAAINIPNLVLNKALKANDYELYIGAMQGNIGEKIYNGFKKNPATQIIKERITNQLGRQMYEMVVQKDSTCIYRAIFNKESPTITIAICIVGNNQDKIRTLFDTPNFINSKLK